jgi:hypothetical protein
MPRLWRKRVSKRTAYEQAQYVKAAAKSGEEVYFTDGSSSDDSNHSKPSSKPSTNPSSQPSSQAEQSLEDGASLLAKRLRYIQEREASLAREQEEAASLRQLVDRSRLSRTNRLKKLAQERNQDDSNE